MNCAVFRGIGGVAFKCKIHDYIMKKRYRLEQPFLIYH